VIHANGQVGSTYTVTLTGRPQVSTETILVDVESILSR
jgi:malate/lactate dehydrogenase